MYYLQLTQPNGKRSKWKGGYRSKKFTQQVADDFRRHNWKVRTTEKPSKWNK